MDRVTQLVEEALAQGRTAARSIEAVVVPVLPSVRRGMATAATGQIADGRMFHEDFLQLLDAMSDAVAGIVESGTAMVWRGHEYDPTCGDLVPVRDQRTEGLAKGLEELRTLRKAVAATLDAVRAYRIANELLAA